MRDALEQITKELGLDLKATLAEASTEDVLNYVSRCHMKRLEAISHMFPVADPDPAVVEMVFSLNKRLQEANNGRGRELERSDSDLVYPLLTGVVAALPAWLDSVGGDWPLKVEGQEGDKFRRISVLNSPAFDLRLHWFGVDFADVTPHTHNTNFFSLCIDGQYEHHIFRRTNDAAPLLPAPCATSTIKVCDRWPRVSGGAFGQEPAEKSVHLDLQLAHQHSKGSGYFLHNAAIHAVGHVLKEVVTVVIRSKLNVNGVADCYSPTRPEWWTKNKDRPSKEVIATQAKEWAGRLRQCAK